MKLPRCSGILFHPTSLPSRFGIGDFGPSAFEFVDQLQNAGQSLWQVLPLGPIGVGDSPYQAYSAFAGEPLLISPELLVQDGILDRRDLASPPQFPSDATDYDAVRKWKTTLLTKASQRFSSDTKTGPDRTFQQFCADHASWLDDYALFTALRHKYGLGRNWTTWDKNLVKRNPAALAKAREELAPQVECEKYLQSVFYRQWGALRQHCSQKGIRIIGDIPIYVSPNSADVWAHPSQFLLADDGQPKCVAGVPPDYFSETGQLWGNPIYNWQEMEQSGFHWWIERFRGTFRLYDVLRVDHFRGFEAYWEVPAEEKTAVNGRWVKAPGEKLFRTVHAALGEVEIIAENLGVITPEVEALREKFGFPGMAVLQFAFGIEGNAANYRPHNLEREVIAYTGTHDNDTIMGWWNSDGGDSTRSEEDIQKEKDFTLQYLGPCHEPMNWKMLRALLGSVAHVAIAPMQDVLGLGSDARMNRPGVGEGNWRWRMLPDAFNSDIRRQLREMSEIYDRVPKNESAEKKETAASETAEEPQEVQPAEAV